MKQTVFITKYCLSSSIFKVEAEIDNYDISKKGIIATAKTTHGIETYFNDDFHFSEEEAIQDFKKRKAKKIESLKNQLAKLENKQPDIV